MNRIKVVDVTLRDGGYRNNFQFSEAYAQSAISQLASAGIEYCEVGYCKGPYQDDPAFGMTAKVDARYLHLLRDAAADRIGLVVMVHPQHVRDEDLVMLHDAGVEMVRVCLRPSRLEQGLACMARAKAHRLQVSANITHVTQLQPAIISDMCLRAENAGADILTFADSNGSMIPADVDRLIGRISRRVLIPLGFHAHNNLSLALANAIAAVEAGAEYIDTSICGMGKGAGNLHLGMFVAYLQRAGLRTAYDLVELLNLSQHTAEQVPLSHLPASLLDVLTATYDLSFDTQAQARGLVANGLAASEFHAMRALHEQRRERRCTSGPSLGHGIEAPRLAQGGWA